MARANRGGNVTGGEGLAQTQGAKPCRKLGAGGKAGVPVAARVEARGGDVARQSSGLSGGRCSGRWSRWRGALSAKGFWLLSKVSVTAWTVGATEGTRDRNHSVHWSSTGESGHATESQRPQTSKRGWTEVVRTLPDAKLFNRTRGASGDGGGMDHGHDRQAQPNCARHPCSKRPAKVCSALAWTTVIATRWRPGKRDGRSGRDSHCAALRCRAKVGIWRSAGCSLKT